VGGSVGAQTRAAADAAAAGEIGQLARVMRPGVSVRVERTRPSWCAGWIEDVVLHAGTVSELLEYLQEECGGRTYRCSVLLPNGLVAFESVVHVAGKPLHEGRPIDRDEWNGERSSSSSSSNARRDQPRQRNSDAAEMGGMLGFLKLFVDMQRDSTKVQVEQMRELAKNLGENNTKILSALQAKQTNNPPATLAGQLGELLEGARAIEKAKRMFGAAAPRQSNGGDDDEEDGDVMKGAMKEAMKHFLGNAIASNFTKRPQGQGGPQRRPMPQQRRPNGPPPQVRHRPTVADSSGIPDALQSGHKPN
jgi:hypothetical protein